MGFTASCAEALQLSWIAYTAMQVDTLESLKIRRG